jgi:hypothetical protein
LGKITQRAGQTLEKIKPVNLSVDQSLMNMGVVGATKSSMSGPVPNNLPNTEENTTQQKKTDQLDNQITPPNKTNLPQAVKPFGGRSKNELMQLALAQGATYKDLQEISNIYDTITPDPKNIDNLMTQRKSLADAGFDTSSVDKQLADMGYSKTGDAATKAKSAAALQVEGKANAGLKAIDSMETLISSDKGLILSTNIPMVEALKGQNRKQYEADIASLTDAIGGLRTGASVSKEQQIFYNKMLPKIGDSPETISLKLAAIRRELNGYINQNVVDTPVQP